MKLPPDSIEFVALLNSNRVDYLVIGAHALAFHGHPRYTGDLDVLVRRSKQNAAAVMAAIEQFGFHFPQLSAADFEAPHRVVQLGVPPVRIDLLTTLTGIDFDEAWSRRQAAEMSGVPVFMLSKEDLVANKKALGRARDIADLECLEDRT